MVKIVNDNYTYAKVAKYIKNRKEFTDEMLEGLEEIVMDSAKAQAILDASRSSMGKLFYVLVYRTICVGYVFKNFKPMSLCACNQLSFVGFLISPELFIMA